MSRAIRGRRGARRGLSLVEILVALAIFVIGLLAILRIFPRGLGLVTTVADRNEAIRLGESRLNDLLIHEARLPDMILTAGQPTQTDPGEADFGFLRLPATAGDYRPYDLDVPYADPDYPEMLHALMADDRLVIGERLVVGRGVTYDSAGDTVTIPQPQYTLFGPIQADGAGVPEVAAFREFERVSPSELQVTVVNGSAYLDHARFAFRDGGLDPFTRAPQADELLFEHDSADRLFVVRLAHRDSYGIIRWVQLQPLQITASGYPSSTSYVTVDIQDPSNPAAPLTHVLPESITVRQVLEPVSGGTFGRFQYDTQFHDVGQLRFSPSLAGETVSLEYVVDDWRNLQWNAEVPIDSAGLVAAGGNVVAPPERPGELVLQMPLTYIDESFVPRLLIVPTGERLPIDQVAWANDPGYAAAGQIPLDETATVSRAVAGTYDVTVVYRRLGNWATVPALAPLDYLLEADAAALVGGGAASYPVEGQVVETQTADVGGSLYTELLFRPSEANRTVAVTYQVGSGSNARIVAGELHVVPPQPNRGSGADERHAIRLRVPGVATNTGVTPARPEIFAIEGRSLQMRVLYDDENVDRDGAPVDTPADPGLSYVTAEQMVELGWYVRRQR